MIRFLFRFIGFWLVAGGFVALIVDGTRSIASSALVFTSTGDAWFALSPGTLEQAERSGRAGLPLVWNTAILPLLSLPAFLLLVVVGLILLALGRVRERSRFEVSR
ncbi:hypothetical protein [Xanthobacter autotrophicus]|uniref:hypothetical protein n=1 Tax=Xanthobacter autotrophicus TaxID=280 RepID=UPI0024A714B1|nr:hypothetical protein [Xanthobacter autotrophicus]MDI4658734.1 hypothetical protein [Xanthobacter autotrophicus]